MSFPASYYEYLRNARLTGVRPESVLTEEEFKEQLSAQKIREERKKLHSFFDDVVAFHSKFDLDHPNVIPPGLPSLDTYLYRRTFLIEELFELDRAYSAGSLSDFADALVDLVYVALGTASLAGLPFNEHWAEVQRANMTKERAAGAADPRSKRRHHLDVVKPTGWTAPNHEPILIEAMRRHGLVPSDL